MQLRRRTWTIRCVGWIASSIPPVQDAPASPVLRRAEPAPSLVLAIDSQCSSATDNSGRSPPRIPRITHIPRSPPHTAVPATQCTPAEPTPASPALSIGSPIGPSPPVPVLTQPPGQVGRQHAHGRGSTLDTATPTPYTPPPYTQAVRCALQSRSADGSQWRASQHTPDPSVLLTPEMRALVNLYMQSLPDT